MKKYERVKSQQDFQKVISSQQRFNSKNFVVYYLKNEQYSYPRFGIAASKKLGNAVTRNKIRRQVRAMIQQIKKVHSIEIKDYVIIVKKTYLTNDYQTNLEMLENVLIKSEEIKWRKSGN